MITLNHYLPKLNAKDKALICRAMREHGSFPDAHNGLLPFFKMTNVIAAITRAFDATSGHSRVWADLCIKLEEHKYISKDMRFFLYLNDVKVHKRFGTKPGMGIIIPGTGRVKGTAGLSWNLGKKAYTPHKVEDKARASLWRHSKNRWLVSCQPKDRNVVATFLMDHCS